MAQETDLKIFISYSRADASTFAHEILNGLKLLGFTPYLDVHDIVAGELWEDRLENLINACDTMVFVISPGSAGSDRCKWEIDKAKTSSKRIIPIVASDVDEKQLPDALHRLNFIYFCRQLTFMEALKDLVDALQTDVEWIREHTRINDLAVRWEDRGRPDVALLRGSELATAKAWLAAWTSPAPEPNDGQRAFIAASEHVEQQSLDVERQRLDEIAVAQSEKEVALTRLSRRTTLALIGSGGLTATAGGLAYWASDAEARFEEERQRVADAEARSVEAAIATEASRLDIRGQIAAYATAPGGLAADGEPGGNSPFTASVLTALEDRDQSFVRGLMAANESVVSIARSYDFPQQPYLSTDANGDVYMRRPSPEQNRQAICVSSSLAQPGSPQLRLQNAERDARSWADFLGACGFDVELLIDPTLADLKTALEWRRFVHVDAIERLDPNERDNPPRLLYVPVEPITDRKFNFFFYSGVGVKDGDTEGLILENSEYQGDDDENQSIANVILLNELLAHMKMMAQLSAIVLDTNFTEASDIGLGETGNAISSGFPPRLPQIVYNTETR